MYTHLDVLRKAVVFLLVVDYITNKLKCFGPYAFGVFTTKPKQSSLFQAYTSYKTLR